MTLALIFAIISAQPVAAESLRLKESDIPQLVETRNSRALGAKDHVQAAQKLTGHFQRSYLPNVEARAGAERFKTGTLDTETQPFGGVEAALNVFNSGHDSLEESVRKESLFIAESRSDRVLRTEIKKARQAFWMLVSQKELFSLLEEALRENSKNLSAANTRIRAGSATDTDRLEFEMYKVELEQDLARLALAIEKLQRELGSLLNQNLMKVETPSVVGHEHDDTILSATFDPVDHPEARDLTAQGNVASLKRAQATRTWLPRIDLFANQTLYTFREREYSDQANRWDTVLGVQLSMRLFNGGNSFAEGASFAAEAAGLEREARQTRIELSNQFENSKAELKLSHQLIHDSEVTLQRNARYFSRSMDEYRRGVKNSLDILNVSQRTLSVKKRYLELRRDYQIARADLLAILGK